MISIAIRNATGIPVYYEVMDYQNPDPLYNNLGQTVEPYRNVYTSNQPHQASSCESNLVIDTLNPGYHQYPNIGLGATGNYFDLINKKSQYFIKPSGFINPDTIRIIYIKDPNNDILLKAKNKSNYFIGKIRPIDVRSQNIWLGISTTGLNKLELQSGSRCKQSKCGSSCKLGQNYITPNYFNVYNTYSSRISRYPNQASSLNQVSNCFSNEYKKEFNNKAYFLMTTNPGILPQVSNYDTKPVIEFINSSGNRIYPDTTQYLDYTALYVVSKNDYLSNNYNIYNYVSLPVQNNEYNRI